MRNPTYQQHNYQSPEDYEKVCMYDEETSKKYWEFMDKGAYRDALESTMDFINVLHVKTVSEFRAGSGQFLTLLEEYRELMGDDYRIESFGESIGDTHIIEDDDIIFMVESRISATTEGWGSDMRYIWDRMKSGAYLAIIDSETPTFYRNYPLRFRGSNRVLSKKFDIAYTNVEHKNRRLKLTLYRKS